MANQKESSKAVLKKNDVIAVAADHMMEGIYKLWCKDTLDLNSDRIEYFKNRIIEKNLSPKDAVIVCLSVDDHYGEVLADIIMPIYDWQEIRNRGEKPFARGIVDRNFIYEALNQFDKRSC